MLAGETAHKVGPILLLPKIKHPNKYAKKKEQGLLVSAYEAMRVGIRCGRRSYWH